jgi:hypothetical protein
MSTGGTPRTAGSIRGRTRHRYSPAWRQRRCRGSWHSGVTQVLACLLSDTHVRRSIGRWVPVMRAGMEWTCMRGSSSRQGSAIGSSGSAGTPCGRPSRPSGSPSRPTVRCGSRSGTRGRMGRRTCRSTRPSPGAAGRAGPRPRMNLILYYGVLGARAAWPREVVPCPPSGQDPTGDPVDEACATATRDTARSRARGHCWAALMKRTFPPRPFGLRRGLAVALRAKAGGFRCAGLSALWQPPAPHRAHRGGGCHRSHPRVSRSPYGPARRPSSPCAAALRRGGRRARRRVRIGPLSDGSWPSMCRRCVRSGRPGVLDGLTSRRLVP